MNPLIGAGLVSAGANLLGGFLGRSHQDEQFERNAALQREFAQSGIQWKVADAKKAGIHPLYAMGAPSISPAVSVQSDPLASSLSSMGQDISRSMVATQSSGTRDEMFSKTMAELQLKNLELRNNYVAAQIAKLQGGQVGPPLPTGDFNVPENPKPEQRPPLMAGGTRWNTNPNTSPMKAWEDQYGDEGPVASTLPLFILWNDMKKNPNHPMHPNNWGSSAWRWIDAAAEEHINRKLAPPPISGRLSRGAQPMGRR